MSLRWQIALALAVIAAAVGSAAAVGGAAAVGAAVGVAAVPPQAASKVPSISSVMRPANHRVCRLITILLVASLVLIRSDR